MNFHYDTSALCRNYHSEVGSDKVAALLATAGSRHVISRVTHLEIQSAVALDLCNMQIIDQFVCADSALLRFAAAEGLSTINPNLP